MKSTRKIYDWKCGNRTLRLGERTLVMGILNVTPDSFSDGGAYVDPEKAVAHALEMVEQGAAIIDIGGESTRPGADPVSVEEEIRRTAPIIAGIRAQSDIPISIDTMKAPVAAAAMESGADIINDVSAFEIDPEMARVAADTGAGVVLMHMKGTPRTMQANPEYDNVTAEVSSYLLNRVRRAEEAGIARNRIVLDPGIGFGKTLEHNLQLMKQLPELLDTGYPVLIGASRKSFIGSVTGRTSPNERLAGSLGIAAWSITCGAHILRVHDVIDTCDVCLMLDRFSAGES